MPKTLISESERKNAVSPEEKLIRIIRNKGKLPPKTSPEEKLIDIIKNKNCIENIENIETVNKTPDLNLNIADEDVLEPLEVHNFRIKIIIGILFMAILSIPLFIYHKTHRIKAPDIVINDETEVAEDNNKPASSIEKIIEFVSINNILDTSKSYNTSETGSIESFNDLLEKYLFTGAIYGNKPQVIIQDKTYGTIHYLYEGESLYGVKILKISKGIIIVSYNGHKHKIRL